MFSGDTNVKYDSSTACIDFLFLDFEFLSFLFDPNLYFVDLESKFVPYNLKFQAKKTKFET